MKIRMKLLIILLVIAAPLAACPTCVGRITKDSKPFFSDEFYVSYKSMDHLYQAINEAQPKNEKKDDKQSTQKIATNSTTTQTVHKK